MLPSRRAIGQTVNLSKVNRGLIAETGILPDGMQLLRDTHAFEVLDTKHSIMEDMHGVEQPILKVTGLFQEGDKQNANGRIYSSSDVLAPAVRGIQEDVTSRAVIGEFDHPTDAKLHLDRVSHLITKIWQEGRKVYGEAEVLHKLPHGACLRGLFEHKVRVGISSRGVGDMEVLEHGGNDVYRVLPGYAFVTWDVVAEPSVAGAVLSQISESIRKRTRPIYKACNRYSPEIYNAMLVHEINRYFNLS